VSQNVLPPAPDFRYVGLEAAPRFPFGVLESAVAAAGATIGAGIVYGFSSRGAIVTALTGAAVTLVARKLGGPRAAPFARRVPMAVVPWGVLVEPDDERPRVLRWAAIEAIEVQAVHTKDTGTSETLWSVVTVHTARERFCGRAPGAVALESAIVHAHAYADEAAHAIALDLDGQARGEGPTEPDVEPLLASACAFTESAAASNRLGLAGGYRQATSHAPSDHAVEELRRVLRDRTPRDPDPRAFAAVVAAEIHATDLADDLLHLVYRPHPVVAAVAKVAARKLGASSAHTGSLDEVGPFLMERDIESLTAWGGDRLTPEPPTH
jgi:hypothetical protein